MSKLVTNFGDSTTTGNTTLQQNLTVQGAFSTFSGSILAGSAYSNLGNTTNKFNSLFATSANITSINTTTLTSTTGFIGINGPAVTGTALTVSGNVYASNALSAPTVIATTSMNVISGGQLNTASIYGPLGVIGVNQAPSATGATLQVTGNVYASNALSAPSVFATTSMNVISGGQLNTASIYGPLGVLGVNQDPSASGASLQVGGNVYASNALSAPSVFATTSMNVAAGGQLNTASIYGASGGVNVGSFKGVVVLNIANAAGGAAILLNSQVPPPIGCQFKVPNGFLGDGINPINPNQIYTITGANTGYISYTPSDTFQGYVSLSINVISDPIPTSTLYIIGNVYASNALSAPAVFATTSMNVISGGQLNTASIYGPLGVLGVNQAPSATGATLQVTGNVYASNALSAPSVFATMSMNVISGGQLNTASIYGPLGVVGVNQDPSASGASLQVGGNVYASNALSAPAIFATTSMNVISGGQLNTASIYGPLGVIGVNQTPATGGATLQVGGNVYASNALTAQNVIVTTMNISSILNTQSIYSSTGLLGINTSTPGATLHVQGNIYASNALTAPMVLATTSLNVATLNTTSIFGTSGQVSIGTTAPTTTASLYVNGNLYATTINTTAINTVSLNTTTINTTAIYGTSQGILGVGGQPLGSTLDVLGNLWASNTLSSKNIISTTANITTLNSTSIYSTGASIGINTTATGASLMIAGNLYASNALTATNIIATGSLYYGEDLFKRGPYLTADGSNATTIQSWVSATCNAVYQTKSFWAMSGTPSYGNIAAGPQGQSDYSGSVLLPDGRVLFVPYSASNIGFFNPGTGLFSTVTPVGLAATASKFCGGVLLPNGNVVFVPQNSANIGMFNPISYTYSNILTIGSASQNLFQGGVLAPNGNVIFTPYNSGNVGVYNPSTAIFSNITGPGLRTNSFAGSVLLPSGNTIFVPSGSSNVGMFNTWSLTYSNYYAIYTTSRADFSGGVLAPNGNVVFVPGSTSSVGVFNPTTKAYSSVSAASGSQGGCLSPSGNIIFSPAYSGSIGLFDPGGVGVYSGIPCASAGATRFVGATQLPDGRVVFCPYQSTNVGVLNTIAPADPAFCLAPYFNKF